MDKQFQEVNMQALVFLAEACASDVLTLGEVGALPVPQEVKETLLKGIVNMDKVAFIGAIAKMVPESRQLIINTVLTKFDSVIGDRFHIIVPNQDRAGILNKARRLVELVLTSSENSFVRAVDKAQAKDMNPLMQDPPLPEDLCDAIKYIKRAAG